MITAPIVFGRLHVLPIISAFLATYPDIDIRLLLLDRVAHLADDHIDLAVRIGELPDSSLMATKLGTVRRVVCGSPGYFAAQGTPRRPADLSARSCIAFDSLAPATFWGFADPRRPKGELSVPIHPRLGVNTAEAAIDAAISGLGITRVLSYQVAHAVKSGALRIVLRKFEPSPLPVSLVYAPQGSLPRKMQVFLEFAVPKLRRLLI